MSESAQAAEEGANGVGGGALYAAGLNAHGQLRVGSTQDIRTFTTIDQDVGDDLQLLFAGWSTTILLSRTKVVSFGHQTIDYTLSDDQSRLKCSVGDHDGMKCCLDNEGRLYLVESHMSSQQTLRYRSTDDSPRLGQIALAENGRVAITAKQTPNGQLCHCTEFSSFANFLDWYEDPSGNGNYPEQHHMLPGRPKQLLASTASFLLLMESGEVYTWGDGRYQSLGRNNEGDTLPANKPALVEALNGIRISKTAAGGWISAALSGDGALYVWGALIPNDEGSIHSLVPGEVTLVELPVAAGAEPLDVVDVAVGSHHIAVVAAGHRLFVVGQNRDGQLGISSSADFVEDWQEVKSLPAARSVFAGPKATFAMTV